MPLKLTLKPGEKFVINGAVVANGDRRSTIIVQNKASILREKDILQQEAVNSPAKRIYFPIMMMYLEEGTPDAFYDDFALRMTEFMSALQNPDALAHCVGISKDVMSGSYYKALMKCRKLIEYETTRLEYVSEGLSANPDQHGDAA